MTRKPHATDSEEARLLQEALETASGLNACGVLSETDMVKIRSVCKPSTYQQPLRRQARTPGSDEGQTL